MINQLRNLLRGQSSSNGNRLLTSKVAQPASLKKAKISKHHNMPTADKPATKSTHEVVIRGSAVAILPKAIRVPDPTMQNVEGIGRNWLAQTCRLPGRWKNHGVLHLLSGQFFVGDPTWGDDYHLRTAQNAPVEQLNVWTFGPPRGHAHLVWLQARDTLPVNKSDRIAFGVDEQAFAFGDLDAGLALAKIRESNEITEFADGYALVQSHLKGEPKVTKWIHVPPENREVFLVSTGKDAALSAVWCHASDGALAGILIDVAGCAEDGKFLEANLPNKS